MTMKTPPTAEQVLGMMKAKMGPTLPEWTEALAKLAPDLIVATGMTSAQSVGREESTIPAKYRHLIAVATALGRGQKNCADTQAFMARQAGATTEEIVDVIRITRHLAAAGILDAASDLLKDLKDE